MTKERDYVGDGVYVEFDGLGLVLTTENGIEVTNRIVLEPEVFGALLRFVARHTGKPAFPAARGADMECNKTED